jgi:hypothetical protein
LKREKNEEKQRFIEINHGGWEREREKEQEVKIRFAKKKHL